MDIPVLVWILVPVAIAWLLGGYASLRSVKGIRRYPMSWGQTAIVVAQGPIGLIVLSWIDICDLEE